MNTPTFTFKTSIDLTAPDGRHARRVPPRRRLEKSAVLLLGAWNLVPKHLTHNIPSWAPPKIILYLAYVLSGHIWPLRTPSVYSKGDTSVIEVFKNIKLADSLFDSVLD